MVAIKNLSRLKKNEFFKFIGKKKVYIFKGGGPIKGFRYESADDINEEFTTKKNKQVETGFDY